MVKMNRMGISRKICVSFQPLLFLTAAVAFIIWHNTPLHDWIRTPEPSLLQAQASKNFSRADIDSRETQRVEKQNIYMVAEDIKALADMSEEFHNQFCKHKLFKVKRQPRICLYKPQNDIFVSRSIINSGMWESNIVATVLYHLVELQKKFGQNEVLFMDLGANVGTFTLTALSHDIPTIAVDPLESAVKRLATSIELNEFTPLAKIYKKGISDRSGCGKMKVNVRNKGGSEINQTSCNDDGSTIKTVTLDELALTLPREKPLNILIKMDIQRYEPYAILGGKNLFSQQSVRLVFMEWEEMRNAFRNSSRYDDHYRDLIVKSFDFLLNEMKYEVYSHPEGRKLVWEQRANWSQDIVLAQPGFWWGQHSSLNIL